MNTFQTKSIFIDSDPRINRPDEISYRVTTEFMQKRHDIFFELLNLKNTRVLDVGCCVAASGAYVLDQGADYYLGIEYQSDLVELAKSNLSKFYSQKKWNIVHDSFENFDTQHKFDLVIASGIIYTGVDIISSLKKLAAWGDYILIDAIHPDLAWMSDKKDPRPYEQQESFVALQTKSMFKNGQFPGVIYRSAYPSYRYCLEIMQSFNFKYHDINKKLEQELPKQYHCRNRYAILFEKSDSVEHDLGYVKTIEQNHDMEI